MLNLLNLGVNFNFSLGMRLQDLKEEWRSLQRQITKIRQGKREGQEVEWAFQVMAPQLYNYIVNYNRMNPHSKYKNLMNETLLFLRTNNLIISDADKGMGCTIVTYDWYNSEIHKHLGDPKKYEKIPYLPSLGEGLLALKKTLDNVFGKTKSNRIMSDSLALMKDIKKNIPNFYILPKLHKSPISSRPICPSHSWITAPISKALDEILKPVLEKFPWNLKDSMSMIKNLEGKTFPPEAALLSFDVDNMYGNMDIVETLFRVNAILTVYFDQKKLRHIMRLIKWVLENNYVEYQGQIYLQIKGIAMGTSMAPTIASLFMSHLEDKMFRFYSHIQWENHYFRYIDDGLIIFECGEETILSILTDLQDESARFFADNRTKGSVSLSLDYRDTLPFLDLWVSLIETDNNLMTLSFKPYEKPMNLHLYANPETYYPKKYIFNWISGENIRLIRNSSNVEAYTEAIQAFRDYLERRNYPRDEIQSQLSKRSYGERQSFFEKTSTHLSDVCPIPDLRFGESKDHARFVKDVNIYVRNIPGRHFLQRLAQKAINLIEPPRYKEVQTRVNTHWIVLRGFSLKKASQKHNKKVLESMSRL